MSNITEYNPTFEDFKQENGTYYWWATDLMLMLDYKDMHSFKHVINRAMKAFITIEVDVHEHFISVERTIDNKNIKDYKLTRFACYIVVMNGDPKKTSVAYAQQYFAEQTRKLEVYIQAEIELDRITTREDIKEASKALSSTAKHAGVTKFDRFHNAGYRGLYNMYNTTLAKKRNIDKRKIFEHMGRTELAANLFRLTQTEEKINLDNIQGQQESEAVHHAIGKEVRDMVKRNTGKNPEELPVEKEIPKIKTEIKKISKTMTKQDKH